MGMSFFNGFRTESSEFGVTCGIVEDVSELGTGFVAIDNFLNFHEQNRINPIFSDCRVRPTTYPAFVSPISLIGQSKSANVAITSIEN
jgi:hypothetical protein